MPGCPKTKFSEPRKTIEELSSTLVLKIIFLVGTVDTNTQKDTGSPMASSGCKLRSHRGTSAPAAAGDVCGAGAGAPAPGEGASVTDVFSACKASTGAVVDVPCKVPAVSGNSGPDDAAVCETCEVCPILTATKAKRTAQTKR